MPVQEIDLLSYVGDKKKVKLLLDEIDAICLCKQIPYKTLFPRLLDKVRKLCSLGVSTENIPVILKTILLISDDLRVVDMFLNQQ